jgi:hypothetical protein
MLIKEHLTSEYLKNVAPSSFEIAHLAIEVTKAYIRKGLQIEVGDVLYMLEHRSAQDIINDIDDSEGPIS